MTCVRVTGLTIHNCCPLGFVQGSTLLCLISLGCASPCGNRIKLVPVVWWHEELAVIICSNGDPHVDVQTSRFRFVIGMHIHM